MAFNRKYKFSPHFKAKMGVCAMITIINLVYVVVSYGLYFNRGKNGKEDRLIDPGSRAINACIVS